MVTLDKVTFSYGDTPLLREVSLSLPERGAVCFSAPSGGGKTTLLRLLCGLEQPHSGSIHRTARQTAVVFQENRLLPWLTVAQNVAVAAPDVDPLPFLRAVELADVADAYSDTLSGGMQRRVALARAMAFGGDLLLLDEPFTGLDAALRARVSTALRERFADACIVLISHDPDEAVLFDARTVTLPLPLCGEIIL